MSEEDFGTMNMGRAERTRELELLRRRYRQHRESLSRLAGDAPSAHLASEYQRMIAVIDESLRKIDELETLPVATQKAALPAAAAGAGAAAVAAAPAVPHPARRGMEPSEQTTLVDHELAGEPAYMETPADDAGGGSKTLLIAAVLVAMVALIGWLVWRSGEKKADPVVEDPAAVVEPAQPDAETGTIVDTEPARPAGAAITVAPASNDYGTIAKGTRAARQFEIANTSDKPLTIQLARSKCRCLYYEYASTIPAGGRETVTVTIDGAKAGVGVLEESIAVTAKADPSVSGTLRVRARIE